MDSQKILVVDDEQDMVDLLSTFLSARGYSVIEAQDGAEALQKLDAEKPDLVLLDIKMPRKDGFEFLKEIRMSRRWMPVVIISALTEPVNMLKGYDLEADYYITKPVDLNKVLEAVRIMLSLAPLRKDNPSQE